MKKQFIKSVGLESSYSPIKKRNGTIVVSYGKELLSEEGQSNDESDEKVVCFYQTTYRGKPSMSTIIKDILEDIDLRAQEEIRNGFVYNEKPVYLSVENQLNFSAAYNLAKTSNMLEPITLRVSTNNYITFTDIKSIEQFVSSCTRYINNILQNFWQIKEGIREEDYEILRV